MAAALVEMAVRSNTVPAGGRRPEPLICILAGEATIEQLCELASGVVIHPGLIVPHLARSQVQTFIFDGADRVIAASKQRTFRGMLRRAIQVRDRHCQHPSGCDEPITHCDVDHRIAYTDGGVTAEGNGHLECEPHNRKSDLHGRQPADAIEAARQRRELDHLARQRLRGVDHRPSQPTPTPRRLTPHNSTTGRLARPASTPVTAAHHVALSTVTKDRDPCRRATCLGRRHPG